jgi:hypothetical protein
VYDDLLPHFTEACAWAAGAAGVEAVILQGLWHAEGTGCSEQSATSEVYQELADIPECQPIYHKLRYFEGHKHCNLIMEEDVGFMVGGQGMTDGSSITDVGCGGALGIPVVDTTGGTFKVYYFNIQSLLPGSATDQFDDVLACFRDRGVSQCYAFATAWSEVPL